MSIELQRLDIVSVAPIFALGKYFVSTSPSSNWLFKTGKAAVGNATP